MHTTLKDLDANFAAANNRFVPGREVEPNDPVPNVTNFLDDLFVRDRRNWCSCSKAECSICGTDNAIRRWKTPPYARRSISGSTAPTTGPGERTRKEAVRANAAEG